jgi:hypothetical protein
MNQTSFSSILDRPATESERPAAFPIGSYICIIKGLPRKDKSTKKGTDYIEYTLQPVQAIEGTVDEEALGEFGNLADKELKLTFYITEKSAYRHKEFLEDDLRLDIGDDTHWEAAQKTNGARVVVQIKHTPRDDGKGVYSEIAGTAPVE